MASKEKADGRLPLGTLSSKIKDALSSWTSWWNKDTRGVLIGLTILAALFWLLLQISGCTVSRAYQPTLELGVGVEVSDPVVGRDPVGIIRFRQPLIPDRLHLGFQHLSSIPDYRDRTSVNQVELTVTLPLGRRAE